MAGQGPGHQGEGGPVLLAELLEQVPQRRWHALQEPLALHAGQGPPEVVPEPAQAAPDLFHRGPVDAPVKGPLQAQAQVGHHVLEQQQGLHPGMDLGGDAGLQQLGEAGDGFRQASLAPDSPVHGLQLGIQPRHGPGARLAGLQGRKDHGEGLPVVGEKG